MALKKLLQIKLRNKIKSELINQLPSRYPMIGSAILIRLKKDLLPHKDIIGKAILEIKKEAKSVWIFKKPTRGIFREPQVECISGDCNPIVLHRELKTKFLIDISKLTFSPGNSGERKRLIDIIKKNEVIVDFFACCGNLSLPVAVNKKIKKLIAIEVNSYAYSFLLKNIILNNISDVVSPFLLDNHYWSIFNIADHVLLGYLPAPDRYQVEVSVKTLKKSGGTLHYHWISNENEYRKELEDLIYFIRSLSRKVKVIEIKSIKSVAPRRNHYVARLLVWK